MKKNRKSTLSLQAETVRALSNADLTTAAGGYYSIPCGSRGCSYTSCDVTCNPTEGCMSTACPQ